MNAPRNEAAEAILAGYSAGRASAEITLMGLLLELHTPAAVIGWLEHRCQPELLRLALTHRDAMAGVSAVIEAAPASEQPRGLAGMRALFDRAVSLAPEAAVALYSLGSPEILQRASAEIVDRLREWGLLGREINVLDIGCGIGRIEQALAPHIARVTGIDLSPAMIEEARRRCAELANVEFAVSHGTDLGLVAGQRFDLIIAIDSFPYLIAADPAIAARHVADAAGLLDPGGVLAIFNYSYRNDSDADRTDLARLAARHGFAVERNGTREFRLWDGTTFLLRRLSAPPRRG